MPSNSSHRSDAHHLDRFQTSQPPHHGGHAQPNVAHRRRIRKFAVGRYRTEPGLRRSRTRKFDRNQEGKPRGAAAAVAVNFHLALIGRPWEGSLATSRYRGNPRLREGITIYNVWYIFTVMQYMSISNSD